MFYNNSNATNLTLPQTEKHVSYVIGTNEVYCHEITLLNISDMCEFSKAACNEIEIFFSYSEFVFCRILQHSSDWFLIYIFLACILLIYVLIITIILLTGLIPNVLAISNSIQFSEHTSAALIITLATGLHRLIRSSTISSIYNIDTTLTYNELLGSTLLLRAFIGGYILTQGPLTLYASFEIRDQLIYFIGLVVFSYLFIREQVYFDHGIAIILVFLLFVIVCLIQEWYIRNCRDSVLYRMRKLQKLYVVLRWQLINLEQNKQTLQLKLDEITAAIQSTFDVYIAIQPFIIPVNNETEFGIGETSNSFLLKQFKRSLDPCKTEYKKHCKSWEKLILSIGFPLHIFIDLILPVVNQRLPLHGWSKLLMFFNIVFSTLSIIIFYQMPQLYSLVFFPMMIAIAGMGFFFSRTDSIPKFHTWYAVFGTVICLIFLLAISYEISAVLYLIGILFAMSRSAIGSILLAWSNSILEILITFSLLGLGYRKVAYIALMNSPLIEMILLTGLTILLHDVVHPNSETLVRSGPTGATGLLFTFIEMISSVIIELLTNFRLRKSVGYFKIILYLIYVMHILLIETTIIHGHGSDHNPEKLEIIDNNNWSR